MHLQGSPLAAETIFDNPLVQLAIAKLARRMMFLEAELFFARYGPPPGSGTRPSWFRGIVTKAA